MAVCVENGPNNHVTGRELWLLHIMRQERTGDRLPGKRIKIPNLKYSFYLNAYSFFTIRKSKDYLSWGSAVWPKDQKGLLCLFVNKVLLEHSHAHSRHIVHG